MSTTEQGPPRRPTATKFPLQQRRSLEEANAVSLQLSGNQLEHSPDPQGQRLRQIRKALGLDPSRVATEACISLGQLYELETGGRRLFYSDTLRQQAGRRVAQILGSDWDALAPQVAACESGDATACPAGNPAGSAPDSTASLALNPSAPLPVKASRTSAPAAESSASPSEMAIDPDPIATPARTREHTLSAAGQALRALAWLLLIVVLFLVAARMGWIPGIRLPL